MLARLIIGKHDTYAKAGNAMTWLRNNSLEDSWCIYLAVLIKPFLTDSCDILEVRLGEATY